jgi:acyl-ACP thioesterase
MSGTPVRALTAGTVGGVSVVAPATEFVPVPDTGRVFTGRRRVRLGDVDERARLRFDALARHLQDVATDDTADAGLDDGSSSDDGGDSGRPASWVVRRTMMRVRQSASLDEALELRTFCSGTGRSWAERRTAITGSDGAAIDAVSLWIRIDAASGRPVGLGERFTDLYGASADGRTVSSRLQLPGPPADAERRPWPLRRVDVDPLGHVNNAVHWAVTEELRTDRSRRGCAVVEYLRPIDPADAVDVLVAPTAPSAVEAGTDPDDTARVGWRAWLVSGTTTLAALAWEPAP